MSANRIRVLFVSLLAVFAVSAVASASASAHAFEVCQKGGPGTEKWKTHECNTEKGTGEWSFEPIAAGKTFEFESSSGISLLKVTELGVTIKCTADTDSGLLEPKGATTVTIKFTGCKVFNAANETEELAACTIPEEKIEVVGAADHLTVFESKLADLFEPETGLSFVTIKINGATCVPKGTYEVIGKQQCALPGAEAGAVEHEIVCKPEGSELKLGAGTGDKATFTSTDKVKLKGTAAGWAWKAKA